MSHRQLSLETRVRQNPAVLSAEVGDAIVLLHAEKSAYYDTESVGARVWQEVAEPKAIAELCRRLEQEYDVDPAVCQKDVLGFLEDALTEGVIVIDPA